MGRRHLSTGKTFHLLMARIPFCPKRGQSLSARPHHFLPVPFIYNQLFSALQAGSARFSLPALRHSLRLNLAWREAPNHRQKRKSACSHRLEVGNQQFSNFAAFPAVAVYHARRFYSFYCKRRIDSVKKAIFSVRVSRV